MKLGQLSVDNFGIFYQREWHFSPGFQLIYGPNEAGKSTLLQLIRQTLFGFPKQHPLQFEDHSGEMSARVTFDLADGRHGWFRRRKGTQRVVQGELTAERELDEATLKKSFGGASNDLYERVFAFSLADLAAGEAGLAQADLREALFGVSLGGMSRFLALQTELDQRIEGLFTVRGRKGKEINRLILEIDQAKNQWRDASVRPRDYEALIAEQRLQTQRMREVRASIEQLHIAADRLQRIRDALPLHELRQRKLAEVARWSVPHAIPPDSRDEFLRNRQRIHEHTEELQQWEQDHAGRCIEYDLCIVPPEVLSESHAITALYQQADHGEKVQASLPQLDEKLQALREDCDALTQRLSAVGMEIRQEMPEGISIHLDRIAEIDAQLQRIRSEQDQLELTRQRIVRETDQLAEKLLALGTIEDLAPWQQVVDRQPEWLQLNQQQEGLQERYAAAVQHLEQWQRRLEHFRQPGAGDLASFAPPFAAQIDDYDRRYTELQQRGNDLDRSAQECQAELAVQSAMLQDAMQTQAAPDQSRLNAARERRDRGWRLIREHYLEQSDRGKELRRWTLKTIPSPADGLTQAIADVDALYDQRFLFAEKLAQLDQVRQTVVRLEARARALDEDRQTTNSLLQAWQSDWEALWAPLAIQPEMPTVMRQWLDSHTEWLRWRTTVDGLQQELHQIAEVLARHEQLIRSRFDGESASLPELFRRARSQWECLRDRQQERAHVNDELQRRREELQASDVQRAERATDRGRLEASWQHLLIEYGLPAHWSIASVRAALTLHDQRTQKRQQLRAAEREQQACCELLQDFNQRVTTLAESLGHPSVASGSPFDAARTLYQSLQDARSAEQKRDQFAIQRTRLEKLMEGKRRVIDGLVQRRTALLEGAGVQDDTQFLAVAEAAAQHYELTRQAGDLQRQIEAAAGSHDLTSFLEQLLSTDASLLIVDTERVQSEIQRLDEEYKLAVSRLAVRQERLQTWSSDRRVLELSSELESLRGKLRELVDQWAPLIIARASMRSALERFEREHQPELLTEVSRVLSHMTDGRYRGVHRPIRDPSQLVVETHQGEVRTPAQLSTGTREQLYLAVRLAFMQRYCQKAEPLPIVMDDVLVNFDDQRAARTLQVIAELGTAHQILFLTCHSSTVEHARKHLDNLQVVDLDSDANSVNIVRE